MKKLLVAGLAILGSLGVVQPALAESVTTSFTEGDVFEVFEVTNFSTFGSMMQGMTVTAHFSGGGSETLEWGVLSSSSAGVLIGVENTNWSLTMSNTVDTFDETWILNSKGAYITSLVLDGISGNIVFDKTFYDSISYEIGTPGSGLGETFTVEGSNLWDIVVDYRDAVRVPKERFPTVWVNYSEGVVGDIYRYLTINFDTTAPFGPDSQLTFYADTDNVIMNNPVPEPATLLLFATGLAGLAAVGRRRHI